MKKTHLVSMAIVLTLTLNITTYAASNTPAEDLYNQLVAEQQDVGTVYIDDTMLVEDVITQMVSIDSSANSYDGEMAIYKAPNFRYSRYNTGKLEITLINSYTATEADDLLDIMQKDIQKNLNTDSSQAEILNEIIRYIGRTFNYDHESYFARLADKSIQYQNFIDAYYGNHKIVCGQYAALTKFLCERFGIDCKVVHGNDHLYNLIKLEGQSEYSVYDTTLTAYHLPCKVGYILAATGTYIGRNDTVKSSLETAIDKVTTSGIKYHFSFTLIEAIAIIIIVSMLVILITRYRDSSKLRRKQKHMARSRK